MAAEKLPLHCTVLDLASGACGLCLATGSFQCPSLQVGHDDYVVAVAYQPPKTLPAYPNGAIVSGELRSRVHELVVKLCRLGARTVSILKTYQPTSSCLQPPGSRDKSVIVWDTAPSQPFRRLQGHKWQVTAVAVLPDGSIASASLDGWAVIDSSTCNAAAPDSEAGTL